MDTNKTGAIERLIETAHGYAPNPDSHEFHDARAELAALREAVKIADRLAYVMAGKPANLTTETPMQALAIYIQARSKVSQ